MKNLSKSSIVLILSLLLGCAGAPPAPERRIAPSTDSYYEKAIENEKNGELEPALQNLETAGRIDPHNDKISKKIKEVQTKIRRKAEKHFKRGLRYVEEEAINRARREFLIALRYNPGHQKALDYLKNVLPGKEYTEHTVKDQETLQDIARTVYDDPQMDFLIASFNDLDVNAHLVPGSDLKLPILEAELMSQVTDIEKELRRAEMLFNEKKYEKTVLVATKLLEYDPTNEQAARLVNASYYAMGKRLRYQGKYSESLKMFGKVTPGYRDVQKVIAGVKRTMHKEAEEHYRRGVKFFVNEQLEKAVKEWEITLTLNPDHKKARANIEKTNNLLEKLKTVK